MKEAISVTKLNRFIKDMFTQNQLLYNVMVKGEISNFKESHGNFYFSLKDDSSSITCIMFANYAMSLSNVKDITNGSEVTVTGKVSVYEKSGTYAIYVNKIESTGLGEYFVKLEELKKKLFDMGMFDDSYKKEIPKYSMNIGVVTAETGAAIKDIVKTIKNKNPYARIVLYPSLVQGEDAYKDIIDGIMTLDKMELDNIIIGRGGGSIEDLYCFNDERVAYAIFNAKTPIISAVGHEINDSISDLVADLRVATPTAAGEAATFNYVDFERDLDNYAEDLKDILRNKFDEVREKINNTKLQLDLLSPKAKIAKYKSSIELDREKIDNMMREKLSLCKSQISRYIEMVKSRDVLDKLSKGLAYVTKDNGKKVKSLKDVKVNDLINLRVVDGSIKTKVERIVK